MPRSARFIFRRDAVSVGYHGEPFPLQVPPGIDGQGLNLPGISRRCRWRALLRCLERLRFIRHSITSGGHRPYLHGRAPGMQVVFLGRHCLRLTSRLTQCAGRGDGHLLAQFHRCPAASCAWEVRVERVCMARGLRRPPISCCQ